jgi:hypothetical protein
VQYGISIAFAIQLRYVTHRAFLPTVLMSKSPSALKAPSAIDSRILLRSSIGYISFTSRRDTEGSGLGSASSPVHSYACPVILGLSKNILYAFIIVDMGVMI